MLYLEVFLIVCVILLICADGLFNLKISKKVKCALLALVIIDILFLTVLGRNPGSESRFEISPLHSYINMFLLDWKNSAVFIWEQIIGNVVVFIPVGFIVSDLLSKKRFIICVLSGLSLSFLIEMMQFLFETGKAEVDDIINNTLGAVFGFLIFSAVQSVCRKEIKNAVLCLIPIAIYGLFMLGCMFYCSKTNVFY